MSNLLSPAGIISVADFYVQSAANYSSRNYSGGVLGRHVNWFSRQFWRIWFEFDRVNLEEGRRDYLEYTFGTVLAVNERNVILGGIPYYVWIGCPKTALHNTHSLAKLDATITNSPYLSPVNHEENRSKALEKVNETTSRQLRSKGFEAAVLNLSVNLPLPSFFYQNSPHRIYYDELLEKHTQFNNSYIYAFAWEDPRVDQRILKLTNEDVVLAITSGGDNLLSYIIDAAPKRVHAVDMNPAQNHMFELKIASFSAQLPHDDIWKIFAEGKHPQFREILIGKLSPHLSTHAFQFWLDRTNVFTSPSHGGLYETGQSGIALCTVKWIFRVCGIDGHVKKLCSATTLNQQKEIWREKVRPVMLSKLLSSTIIGNEKFLWKALGVPVNQRNLILQDYYKREQEKGNNITSGHSGHAMWEYVINTLDPIVEESLLSNDNYFYLLCLLRKYTKESCPGWLHPDNYKKLTTPGTFNGVRMHTDEIQEVLARLKPGTLTVAVVMDSMDWFDPEGTDARSQIRKLNDSMKIGGRVMLRSAGMEPWYLRVFEQEGYTTKRVGTRNPGTCIDRYVSLSFTHFSPRRRRRKWKLDYCMDNG